MEKVRTILLNRSAYADNDLEANALREYLKDHNTFVVNLMSSPGAGKTTTLIKLINLMCHLDAGMTKTGLDGINFNDFDLIFLENVGNLVCPAEFDTGASMDMMILSVPEGDDKPIKYPLVFEKSKLVLINKIDALPYFDFNMKKCISNIKYRNKNATIIPISAKTGENIELVAKYFKDIVSNWRNN